MSKRYEIVYLLKSNIDNLIDTTVNIKGWVRTKRGNKNVAFIAINDGSIVHNIQVVVDLANFDEELLQKTLDNNELNFSKDDIICINKLLKFSIYR